MHEEPTFLHMADQIHQFVSDGLGIGVAQRATDHLHHEVSPPLAQAEYAAFHCPGAQAQFSSRLFVTLLRSGAEPEEWPKNLKRGRSA